jgi:hypothetical protein
MRMTIRHDLLLLLALATALLWAILMMTAPSLSDLDLGGLSGGGSSGAESAAVRGEASPPTWTDNPLEPPLDAMRRAAASR